MEYIFKNPQIEDKIDGYKEEIEKALDNGDSIEIHASKDGIKVLKIKKSIIKQ